MYIEKQIEIEIEIESVTEIIKSIIQFNWTDLPFGLVALDNQIEIIVEIKIEYDVQLNQLQILLKSKSI